jgi:hypothetical protein
MRWWMAVTLVMANVAAGLSGTAPQRIGDARAQLKQAYPEVQFLVQERHLAQVYGTAFGYGLSTEQSADTFVQTYAQVFGASPADLLPGNAVNDLYTLPMYDDESGTYKGTVVCYRQYQQGIPVYGADLRLLVQNKAGYPLILANSSLVDLGDFVVPATAARISEGAAHAAAAAFAPGLINFGTAELVIWPDPDGKPRVPRVALSFEADNGLPATPDFAKFHFVADAISGEILHADDLILHTNVTGSVHGQSTTPPKADICSPEVDMAMPYAKVAIGSTVAYADAAGNFTIPNGGTSPVTVTSYMAGQYFVVADQGGGLETLTQTVTPPGPANFMHNAANTSEFIRSEVNSYIQANVVRDWVLVQNPLYPTIPAQTGFQINVNLNQTCNAYYDGVSINFYRAGGGCSNTGYANVVHHEYGHHIVQCGGSGQDAYGEGMADCTAVCIADNSIIAPGFYSNDCTNGIRDANNNLQYPCSGEIHYCGQLIAGCVWSTRNALTITNPSTYLAIISKLTLNSVPLHGPTGNITPAIYNDFIAVDNTYYSGAHQAEITAGFQAHNMIPLPPPANDLCANAIEACPGTPATGNTSSANVDGATNCGTANSTPDVWYKYTPATSGSATFSLCGYSPVYDSVMSIHSGCPGTSGNTLNCDDDGCGGSATFSTITRSVTAGTTYIIRISGWSGSTGSFGLNITGPACQSANYTLTTSVSPTGAGSIALNPPGGSYAPGTTVTCTANATTGYHFDHWTGDLSGSTNPTTIVMNGNKSITAVFVLNTYTLTVNTDGQGTVALNPPGGSYTHGTTVQLTANAATGWHFDHWSGDLTGSANPTSILMNGNKTVTAWFVQDQYTLTVSIDGQGTVALNPPGGTYPSGTVVQLTASAAAGWHFDAWSGDVTGTANPISVTVGGNLAVTAHFGLLGDMTCDGTVDFGDINPFVLAITDAAQYEAAFPGCYILHGDFNGNGVVDFGDINPFVAALTGK